MLIALYPQIWEGDGVVSSIWSPEVLRPGSTLPVLAFGGELVVTSDGFVVLCSDSVGIYSDESMPSTSYSDESVPSTSWTDE